MIDFLESSLMTKHFDLLRNISHCECEDGWYVLLDDLFTELSGLSKHVRVTQVKEKFGGLRCYVANASQECLEAIQQAEHKSFLLCELCGERGHTVRSNGYWLSTRCDKCELSHEP